MKAWLDDSDWFVFEYREARIDDLRPLQYICAQRLPEGVSGDDVVERARKARRVSEPSPSEAATSAEK